jgi:hypothetical protein
MSEAQQGEAQAPGWYPEPGSGRMRWWDGTQWGAYQDAAAGMAPVTTTGQGDPKGTAALAHYLGVIGIIGPLIIYLTNNKPDTDPFIKDAATEATNFHLTVLIGWVVVMVLSVVTCGLGAILAIPLWLGEIIFSIMGGMAASKGEWYRYPVNVRMIKPPVG